MIAYLVTNEVNGRKYVGITKDASPKRRWHSHVSAAVGRGAKYLLHAAIIKYGSECFRVETIASARTWTDLCEIEGILINQHKTLVGDGGYNLTKGGEGCYGRVFSQASKDKIRQARLGKTHSMEVLARIKETKAASLANRVASLANLAKAQAARTGATLSEQHRARISAANTGRQMSAEARQHLRAALKLRPPPSQETKAKMSIAMKGRVHTPLARQRMKIAASLRPPRPPITEATRARMKAAHTGRVNSIESRQRMRAAAILRETAKRLARTAAIATLCFVIGAAQTKAGGIPVFDGVAEIGQARQLFQELKSYGVQLQQLQHEISSAVSLATTAASLIQHPSLGAVMGLANMVGIDNPLPINPYAVQGMLSGYGGMNSMSGLVGKFSGLGSLVTTSYNTDSVYNCTTGSFACQSLQQRAASNAGLKGISSQIYGELAAHIPVLQGLRTEAAAATDPAQRENIMVQVQLENAWVNNSSQQLQGVIAMASAQESVQRTREEEHLSQSIAAVVAAAPKN